MIFVDSHCHIDSPCFAGEEDALFEKMRAAHVAGCLLAGCSLAEFPRTLAYCERRPNTWCSAGIHPSTEEEAGETNPGFLTTLAAHPKVVAIGECGLDYFYNEPATHDFQKARFARHIEEAKVAQLPVIVHSRDAKEDTMDILRTCGADSCGFVLHCFTGDVAMAREALDLGGYLSFSGILTFKNAAQIQEAARYAPSERILIETDSPYLAPIPFRGKRNDPGYVPYVAAKLAELRGKSVESVAEETTENFFRLFQKADRAQLNCVEP